MESPKTWKGCKMVNFLSKHDILLFPDDYYVLD